MKIRWTEWRGSLDGRPVMWIKRLAAFRGRVVDLHMLVRADDPGCLHTHPGMAIRIILWGGYIEEIEGAPFVKEWRPGMVGIVRPQLSHRVDALRNGRFSLSLWIRGRKRADVQLRGLGWPTHGSEAQQP